MTLEIPGYYYGKFTPKVTKRSWTSVRRTDLQHYGHVTVGIHTTVFMIYEEKKRYFKIEDNRTAPAEASWSRRNVKRRKIERQKAERERERERQARNSRRVKKAVEVWDEPLLGGCFFGREIGSGASLGIPERRRGEMMEDLRRESWTLGLRKKGTLRLWPERNDRHGDVTHMYIAGGEAGGNSGLGAAYAVANFEDLRSRYIPRDGRDEINFGDAAVRYPRIDLSPRLGSMPMPTLSSINYHAPSHKMLLTSGHRNDGAAIGYFSPGLTGADAGAEQPAWRLGGVTPLVKIRVALPHTNRYATTINTLRPAPASSPLTAAAGTNAGILKLQGDNLTWLDWSLPERPWVPSHKTVEIFSVDFLAQNPSHLILAAGRPNDIAVLDTRLPQHSGAVSYIRHTSSVAHVRSVGDYGVLAAGPKSAMAIYDIRLSTHNCHPEPHYGMKRLNKVRPLPVVTFPGYKNEAHVLSVGFDVSDSKGGGLGIVAAAQDDGTVGLFSLASGKKLRSKAVDSIGVGSSALDPPQRVGADGASEVVVRMIKSMMFQTLPGDTHPSLFVGEGLGIRKFSFGMRYTKRGGCFVEEED